MLLQLKKKQILTTEYFAAYHIDFCGIQSVILSGDWNGRTGCFKVGESTRITGGTLSF